MDFIEIFQIFENEINIVRRNNMQKAAYILLSLLITLLAVSGCSKSGSSDAKTEESVPVAVSPVELGNIVQSLNYDGDIKAEYEVKVFSKVPDRIEKFYVEEGDFVRKGEPVAKILATTIEQGVRQAEAGLVSAKAQSANLQLEYERAQRLSKEDAMSQQQFDAIRTQYESIRAQVEQAEAGLASMKSQLGDATITAPISGIIGKRYYDPGDMASPAAPLVSIVQMQRVKIEFNATEEDLGRLANGQKAEIKVKAYPDHIFTGKIYRISPVLDPTTRMAEVEVLVDNPDGLLKPGMYANANVITGVLENVIVVPRHVTIENTTIEQVEGQDQVVRNYYVFVVDSSKAFQKKLDVLYVNHKSIAVTGGISVGDQLVVAGQNNLRDGMAVSVAKKEGQES